ncbi:hypothetical protein EGW08_001626 [Elysia chlorotica]|uniref:Ubiquitin carboxyl-terminal hydrolase n=1 Tax=Elysia chlorotica TaxID=188477 RepID=A0A3S0ZZK7_ELYCH|nr:hypothetical protein EGW08_001626 [Elysia chlorotica]
MDQQVARTSNTESEPFPSNLLPESQTEKAGSAEVCEQNEPEAKSGAGNVPPVAGDSGCQMEDVGSGQPLTDQPHKESVTLSSGESSPVSSQGQDSGLSPDEALLDPSDDQVPPSSENCLVDPLDAKSSSQSSGPLLHAEGDGHKESSLVDTKPEEAVPPSGHTSPEGSGGLSETQVTVSDLDSPASPPPQSGGASAVAEVSGATACAVDSTPMPAAPAAASPSSTSKDNSKEMESVYYIKWITFDGSSVPIITQNENGPCPLLALVNVLLLKGKVKLAPMLEMITSEQLMTYLGECILENTPKDLPETTQANYEQNMQDAMGVMHKLQTGLDVNVKFTGVRDFEYTPELIVFDLLGISLFHGWLVDPQDRHTVEAVNQCSYNQLVEKIILLKHSDKEEMVTQALTAEQFLERSASQLTYHGLAELSSVVKENELCVFFRNNHFNSLYRHNNELFLLVTDQGFLTESQVVWETLSNVEGDCHFTDATFRTYTKPVPSSEPILPDPNVAVGSPEQIDHDYQVALFLQEEAAAASAHDPAWATGYPQEQMPSVQADHDLAMRLQEEENRREALQAQHASGPAQPAGYQYPHQQQQQWARHSGQQHPQSVEATGQRRRADRREREDKSCIIL